METIELKQSVSFKNILLATDFSEVSRKAVPYAAAIAGRYGSKTYLVHVIPTEPRVPVPMEHLPVQLDRGLQNAEREMKTFLRRNWSGEMPHEAVLQQGPVWDAL